MKVYNGVFRRDSFIGFLIVLSQIVCFETYFCGRFYVFNRAQNCHMRFCSLGGGRKESNAL